MRQDKHALWSWVWRENITHYENEYKKCVISFVPAIPFLEIHGLKVVASVISEHLLQCLE